MACLPIVTKQGSQFAARVASSLLSTLNLYELITYTDEEYEKLILYYAYHPIKLKEIKEKLKRNKNDKPLFNTQKYTRDFELGLYKVYECYLNGEKPRDIMVNWFG